MNFEATEIDTPSISSSAMLVEVRINCWTGRKKDKAVSEEVTTDKKADRGTATVTKKLLGDCATLHAIDKQSKNARNASYKRTLPWADTGPRLLSTEQYFKFHPEMTEWQNEFYKLVDDFDRAYPFELAQAQVRLGDLFDPSDYPHPDQIRDKFRFHISYMPVPDAGDFRVDVGNETKQTLTTHYKEYYNEQISGAMSHLWTELHTCLSNMSDKFAEPTEDDKATKTGSKTFRDTLFTNMNHMLEMLKTCNVTGDCQMEAMRLRIEDALHGITPDAVRQDSRLRAETKRAMDDAIAQIPTLDM